MSLRLDKPYEPELDNPSSEAFKKLKNEVLKVLFGQYKSLSGFIGVNINGFSRGSIITQYTVEASEIKTEEISKVNAQIPQAMKEVASVIGSVTASITASDLLFIPKPTYTGTSMKLQCGPPDVNLGELSSVQWKFNDGILNNRPRHVINTIGLQSTLTVSQVILADIGLYECTLKISVLEYIQKRKVTDEDIRPAPNIRVDAEINAECDGSLLALTCCVQEPYKVKWYLGKTILNSVASETNCVRYSIERACETSITKIYTCKVESLTQYNKTTTLTLFPEPPLCNDIVYGMGREGDSSVIRCEKGQTGSKTAVCESNRQWTLVEDTCIVEEIKELLTESTDLDPVKVEVFVEKLNEAVKEQTEAIAESSNTISAITEILVSVSDVTETVTEPLMKNVLEVVDKLSADNAAKSWQVLNTNRSSNASSQLLGSLEQLSKGLKGEFSITTPRIQLKKTSFRDFFSINLNSSIHLNIPNTQHENVSITTILFSSLDNILPARDASFNISQLGTTTNSTENDTASVVLDNFINADVVLIKVNQVITNVTLSYEKKNDSFTPDPQCVFWNFSLLDGLGAWDDKGCSLISDINSTVTCQCNHLTSFSILMSTHIPESIREALDIITYIGVGISLASLVICLIIEGYVWKAVTRNGTAFMRHVSIVNTALCLLIADICFIIAASVAKNPDENPGEDFTVPVGPCSTATFFMHFFYLALFFWMLVSGLLLFYRMVMVFSHMSKSAMLAVGLCVGYGAPLIIAVVTVASTAGGNGYIQREQACWLNWNETMALLALVIPALTIVFINIIILFVVLYKMLRSGGIGDQSVADERHTLKVVVRCVLILTPLFGLTWSLGVGTMVAPTNEGVHIAFAFFNSLQGLFILVFGTLFDSKIRALLARKPLTGSSGSSSNRTKSTSAGLFSKVRSILPGRRNVYHLSPPSRSSTNEPTESYSSI
ncbi:unnamed protein product [Knipowitschia caucasica]